MAALLQRHESMFLDRAGLELGRFLSYLSNREEIIASNIANADTPGYRTRDVALPQDFSGELFSGALEEAAGAVVEVPGLAVRNDGNNVSIDREARLLAENGIRFNLATQILRADLKDIRSAIEEGRTA